MKAPIFTLFLTVFLVCACSEEKIPADIGGTWDVELLEVVDCMDTIQNVIVDIIADPCYVRGTDSICIQDYFYRFDSLATTYLIKRVQTVNGVSETFEEQGNYTIENLNRLVMCNPDCDSLFVVKSGLQIEIVSRDTISGCGTVIRAAK